MDEVWKNRPPMKINPVLVHPLQFAGLSVADKLNVLREKLEKEKARGIIFTTLDEVVSQPYKLLTLVSCLTCKLLLDILFDHLVEHFCEGCVVVQYSWEWCVLFSSCPCICYCNIQLGCTLCGWKEDVFWGMLNHICQISSSFQVAVEDFMLKSFVPIISYLV